MTEDQVKYNPYVVDERSCATCGRIRPDDPACPMSSLDIDTCLGNPSRPFWRPRSGEPVLPDKSCDTCEFGQGKCVVWPAACQQNGFIFWRPDPDTDMEPARAFTNQQTGEQISKKQRKARMKARLTGDRIREECLLIRGMLLEKNRKYGDSAIDPVRIFSSADPVAQIDVRIDDKLSRIRSAQDDDTEDAELDLIGYLILKRVARVTGNLKV